MPEFLSSDQLDLRETTKTLIEELRLLDDELPRETTVPSAVIARVRELSNGRGVYAMTQPKEVGGAAAGPLALTVVRETLAAANLRLARFALGPDPGVLRHASAALQETYLQPVLRGEMRGAFAFTEPRDAPQPTSARRDGDELIVDGRKAYVTGGAEAHFYATLVNIRDPDPTAAGTAMLIIDRTAPGLSFEEQFSSLEGGSHVSLRFDGVRVPQSHVVGQIGEGLPRALRNISDVRLAMSAQACGLAMWTIDFVTAHLLQPHRSGSPLAEHESIRLRFSDLRIETYAARSMLYRTARLAEAGENVINEVIATKVFATESVGRVVDMAVQLVGGQALIVGHPLEELYRRVRSMRLAEGASDLLRLNLAKGRLELGKGRL